MKTKVKTNALAMTGTFSKSPLAWGFEPNLTVVSAQGCHVELSDGRLYVDWVSGLGTNLFGYGYLNDLIIEELKRGGGSHSLPHQLEYEAAELITNCLSKHIPYWNQANLQARFCLSGTDAVTMAVRLARVVTGVNKIICATGGYHGWADWTISRTSPAAGVPVSVSFDMTEFTFNDLKRLKVWRGGPGSVAAVVIEQGLTDPEPGFYDGVRDFCDLTGALFIMDEVVTGLRYGLGGVCGVYDIKPDLVCMGKALGNGAAVAALVGDEKLMSEFAKISPPFCSSTHWGNSLHMAAAKAVLTTWRDEYVKYLTFSGEQLMEGFRSAGWGVIGHPPRNLVTFKCLNEQAYFIHGMREEGVLMNRPNFPTMSHTEEDIDRTIEAARRARAKYKASLERGVEMNKDYLPRVLFSDR